MHRGVPRGHKEGCRCAVCAPDVERRDKVLAEGRRKRADNVAAGRAGRTGDATASKPAKRRVETVKIGAPTATKTPARRKRTGKTASRTEKTARRADPAPVATGRKGLGERLVDWLGQGE